VAPKSSKEAEKPPKSVGLNQRGNLRLRKKSSSAGGDGGDEEGGGGEDESSIVPTLDPDAEDEDEEEEEEAEKQSDDGGDTDASGDESGEEDGSDNSGGESDDPCGECLDPMAEDEEKYRSKNCHYACGVAVRAACYALADKPKLLKKFKALKKKDPKAYARGIKNMRKKGPKGKKDRRTALQKSELIRTVMEVCRVKKMTRDSCNTLMDKVEYWKHMEARRGWSKKKAFRKFVQFVKTEYTEEENGITFLAVPKQVSLNQSDGIEMKDKKKGPVSRDELLSLATGLKGFSLAKDSGKALCDMLGGGKKPRPVESSDGDGSGDDSKDNSKDKGDNDSKDDDDEDEERSVSKDRGRRRRSVSRTRGRGGRHRSRTRHRSPPIVKLESDGESGDTTFYPDPKKKRQRGRSRTPLRGVMLSCPK
jgi:hypothetical protein